MWAIYAKFEKKDDCSHLILDSSTLKMDQVVKFFGFFLFAHVRTFNFKNFGIVHYTGFRQIWFVTQNPFFNRKSGLSFSAFRRLAFSFRHFHNFFFVKWHFFRIFIIYFRFFSVSWSCRFFSFLTYSQNFFFLVQILKQKQTVLFATT